MPITLSPELEVLLRERAYQRGISLENLVNQTLREQFSPVASLTQDRLTPRDDWERNLDKIGLPIGADSTMITMRLLRSIAVDCGVSLSDEAVSRENFYD